MKVMIVVTHLLGTGHLSRALTLGRSYAEAGHDVRVVSGGMPAPHLGSSGVRLVQLPPVRSDGVDFSVLLDANGAVASPEYHTTRSRILMDELTADSPDILITELFPFGRRSLKNEFLQLLKAAGDLHPKPFVFSSIRDILAPPSKPRKAEFAQSVTEDYYDAVLVHSDPAVTPLDASWPVTEALQARLMYTGFVAPSAPEDHPDHAGAHEVLVSAGGGAVGAALFKTALQAAALDPRHKWRILLGGSDAATRARAMRADAPDNVVVEPARPDFRQMLRHARASVSMCGYNTALDVLQTGVPAVFVPFDDGGEVEQSLRAKALQKQGGISVVPSQTLTAGSLLKAVGQVCAAPPRPAVSYGFDGAARTVALTQAWVADK